MDSFNYFDVVKSFDKKYNLITFLCESIYHNEKKISIFFTDMLTCQDCLNIDLSDLETK